MSVNESTPVTGPVYATPPTIATPSRFGTAVGLSIAVAILGVVVWEVLAQTAHVRSALVAFGVAAGIAAVMRAFAPNDRRAPAVIIVLTALSALAGLLASQYALVADAVHVSFFTVVQNIPMSKIPELMKTGTSPMTWVVMAASVYAGFAFSRRLEVPTPHPVVAPPAAPASGSEQGQG